MVCQDIISLSNRVPPFSCFPNCFLFVVPQPLWKEVATEVCSVHVAVRSHRACQLAIVLFLLSLGNNSGMSFSCPLRYRGHVLWNDPQQVKCCMALNLNFARVRKVTYMWQGLTSVPQSLGEGHMYRHSGGWRAWEIQAPVRGV